MYQTQAKESPYTFVVERSFPLAREHVWNAWTRMEEMKRWFGPQGSTMPVCTVDLKPGGAARYCLEFAGSLMCGQWAYEEVMPPAKIVAIVSFTDEKGNIVAHPGSPDWPLEVWSVVTFSEIMGHTKLRIEWSAHNASERERRAFEEGEAGMKQGWSGSLDQLEKYLTEKYL